VRDRTAADGPDRHSIEMPKNASLLCGFFFSISLKLNLIYLDALTNFNSHVLVRRSQYSVQIECNDLRISLSRAARMERIRLQETV
jgi:hypothetical protein